MAKDYKRAVLDRLKDAVILYCKKRYIASLYMSGYVIEIGIKVEFERLGSIDFNDKDKLIKAINYLSNNDTQKIDSIGNFLSLINKIKTSGNEKIERKFNIIADKKSINTHDIKEFIKGLNEWKRAIGETTFNPNWYDIQKIGWKTSLRYGDESATNDSEQEDAKNALEMAIKFLKKDVCLSLNTEDMNVVLECENMFTQADELISSDEIEISSTEQTLNNEDY